MFRKLLANLRPTKFTVAVLPNDRVPLPSVEGRALVASHRGRTLIGGRDNTLEAFEHAIGLGADMVEFDVRKTLDGQLVLCHDATFSKLRVADHTLAELRAAPGGQDMATLEQAVMAMRGRIMLDVELKEAGYEIEALNIVRRHFRDNDFVMTSFRDKAVSTIKEHAPEVCTGLLVGESHMHTLLRNKIDDLFPLHRVHRTKADFLACSYPLADVGVLAQAKLVGVPVVVWTVNDSWRLKWHLKSGLVKAVITDVPEHALAHLGKA